MKQPRYTYSVVTHCGAGDYGTSPTLPKARAQLALLRDADPDNDPDNGWEIQRILELPTGGRRYWLWRKGAWRLYGAARWHDLIFNPSDDDLSRWAA